MSVDHSLSCIRKIRGMHSVKEQNMVPLASSHLDIWFGFWHIRPPPSHLSTYRRHGINQQGHVCLYEAGEALERGVMSNSKRVLVARTIAYILMRKPAPSTAGSHA